MGAHYPAKPMSVYATVWDGSDWATKGGRYKVNYKYAPFVVSLSNLFLEGCSVDPLEQFSKPSCTPDATSAFLDCLSSHKNRRHQWNGSEANIFLTLTVMTLPATLQLLPIVLQGTLLQMSSSAIAIRGIIRTVENPAILLLLVLVLLLFISEKLAAAALLDACRP